MMDRNLGEDREGRDRGDPGRECAAIRELLVPYVDGEAGRSEIERIERHAESCSACRAELDSHRGLTASLRKVLRPEARSLVSASAVRRRALEEEATRRSGRLARVARLALRAAAAILVVGLIALLVRDGPGGARDDPPSDDLLAHLDILEDLQEEGLDPTPELVQWIAEADGGPAGGGLEDVVGPGLDGELLDVFEYLLEEELAPDNL